MEINDNDILFYVKGNEYVENPDINNGESDLLTGDPSLPIINLNKSIPVEKNEFFNKMSSFSQSFLKLFEDDNSESKFALDQIEVNLDIEISGGIKLLLSGKGSAGVKLVYKRR